MSLHEIRNLTKAERDKIDKILKDFDSYILLHPKLVLSINQILESLIGPSTPHLIMFHGPTGVGKSTLLNVLEKELDKMFSEEVAKNPGCIPYVRVEAMATGAADFKWKVLYKQILEKMDEVLIEDKKIVRNPKSSTDQFMLVVKKLFKARGVKVLIVDEAQHIAKLTLSGRAIYNHLETFKSLLNQLGIPIILVGTSDLVTFGFWSSQVARRSIEVKLKPYYASNPEEVADFVFILQDLVEGLPLPLGFKIDEKQAQLIFEASFGSIGHLKERFRKALRKALVEKSDVITQEHFDKTLLGKEQRESIQKCSVKVNDSPPSENKNSNRNPGDRNPESDFVP